MNKNINKDFEDKLNELKNTVDSLSFKANDQDNASNLVDTKNDTGAGSKFFSNEKVEKNKDIEVECGNEENYQQF